MNPIDIKNLEKMIDERYISAQKHPLLDIYILNYTPKAQFDKVWNNETLQCRGLIMTGDNKVVSRPFPKFFNWSEMPVSKTRHLQKKILEGKIEFVMTEKMDGSLGISYFDSFGNMKIATRGSFISEQAIRANKILESKYADLGWNQDYTYLFEIIYPQNRIVVDYGDREDLVLLTVIHTESSRELDYTLLKEKFDKTPMTMVPRYEGDADFAKLEEHPNKEGYVIYFPKQQFRAKIKFEEYKRLHRILTGINAKRIWEILANNGKLDEILDRVPDEFYKWVKDTEISLRAKFYEAESNAKKVFDIAKNGFKTRKEQAEYITGPLGKIANTSVVFAMLDGKPYDHIIWRTLEPKFEKPFKMDEE